MPQILQLLLSLVGGWGASKGAHVLLRGMPSLAKYLSPGSIGSTALDFSAFMGADHLIRNVMDEQKIWEQPPIDAPSENDNAKLGAYMASRRLQSPEEDFINQMLGNGQVY